MDLSHLDRQSKIVPMLVRLYDSQQLAGLAQKKDTAARTELTSIITSLLEMELSPRESELIADVLISLMRQAEQDLCIALAERLSVMDTVPLRLALHLANEDISVARPILKNSPIFSDMDLIYIIKSKPANYWRAIAERESMSDHVMTLLAESGDFDTALTLAKNQNIRLCDRALTALVSLAKSSDALAEPLIRRDEVTKEIVKTLYQCVGMAIKQEIRQLFDMGDDIAHAVDDTILEFSDAVETNSMPMVSDSQAEAQMRVANRYMEKGILTLPLMLKTLKRGQYQSFAAQFAVYMDLSLNAIQESLTQNSGQALAIACKSADVDRNSFVSIYLLASRLINKGGMVEARDMQRAVNYYDRIEKETAQHLVNRAREMKSSIVR